MNQQICQKCRRVISGGTGNGAYGLCGQCYRSGGITVKYLSDCCGAVVDPETVEEWVSMEDWATCTAQPCSCSLKYLGVCSECEEVKPISISQGER